VSAALDGRLVDLGEHGSADRLAVHDRANSGWLSSSYGIVVEGLVAR